LAISAEKARRPSVESLTPTHWRPGTQVESRIHWFTTGDRHWQTKWSLLESLIPLTGGGA